MGALTHGLMLSLAASPGTLVWAGSEVEQPGLELALRRCQNLNSSWICSLTGSRIIFLFVQFYKAHLKSFLHEEKKKTLVTFFQWSDKRVETHRQNLTTVASLSKAPGWPDWVMLKSGAQNSLWLLCKGGKHTST